MQTCVCVCVCVCVCMCVCRGFFCAQRIFLTLMGSRQVHGTLLHAIRDAYGSSAPSPSARTVLELFTLLVAIRPLVYSHGRSAREYAAREQARLAAEQAEAARIAEEARQAELARLAAEAEAARAAAAAAAKANKKR